MPSALFPSPSPRTEAAPVHPPGGSFLSAFADYVHQERASIGRRWMKLVRESPEVPGALNISTDELQDHVPQLLDDLVERLRLEKTGTDGLAAEHSRCHGREQWKAGYNISDLIWEIYIIRQVLTKSVSGDSVLGDFTRNRPDYTAEECEAASALIHDFFHRLTCQSVGQFIKEQERAMQEKNHALQQTNESRERLTRTVSHELRNVLYSLTLAMKLLGEETSEEERREMAALCTRMLSDMSRILNDLLDFSALVAGRAQLALQRLSLPELFAEIVAEWRPVAEKEGLKFESKCDPALGEIVSDRLKLKQIAGNLLSNAIKYRKPAKGGFIGISFAAYGEACWGMVVADTGKGIARADMDALFGEFNRLQPNGTVAGTGLGLAICKEFAELLGGRIEAISESDEGTRFEVTLPISHAPPPGSEACVPMAEAGQPAFRLF